MEQLKQQLTAAGILYREAEPLAMHSTFKIGGPADLFILPETEPQLLAAITACKEAGVKYYLLGNGSNILFEDAGYRGAVIDLSALNDGIEQEDNVIRASAGVRLSALCGEALRAELTGLEFAYGIPGTLGGAIYMNAGAYGGEMKDVLHWVRYLTPEGKIVKANASELELSYRHSIFEENGGCILSAELKLSKGDPEAIRARMNELMEKRREKQPLDKPSGQHLQAACRCICGCADRPVRPTGIPPRRSRRQR